MKAKTGLICALAFVTAFLIGCLSGSPQISLELFCDDFTSQHHVFTEGSIAAGNSFTITLCSNPTTGFEWVETARISDETVLQQTDHRFIAPEETRITGAPGKDIWTFKALKKGTSRLYMEYNQPCGGCEKGEWTFTAFITVK